MKKVFPRSVSIPHRRFRLAVINSHPIQYFAPLYRRLAQEPEIDLTVYYCSRQGVEGYTDPGFSKQIKWDIPLLEGYHYKFLPNVRRSDRVDGFASLINPGVIPEIRRNHYDALWMHGYNYVTHLLALAAARTCNTPVFYRTESSLTYDSRVRRSMLIRFLKPIFLHILFGQVRHFLSIGTLNTEFYLHYGVKPSQIFHVPYTVDNDYFARRVTEFQPYRDEMRAKMGIKRNDVAFLFAAKMTPLKAPLELLKAYEGIRKPGKALIMAGDGELRSKAEAYVSAKKLRGVHFLGFVNQSELPKVYAMSDVFVRPDGISRGDWGLTVNESMASGQAVIATDAIGATVDLVKDGENGFVVRFGDLADLTSAMERMVADPTACRYMGKRSVDIISTWSYQQCVEGILEALRSLYSSR